MEIHVVKSGDTLYQIAKQYGVSLNQLIETNQLPNPARLVVGQTIVIRYPETTYEVQPGDTLANIASANGVSINQLYRRNPSLMARPDLIAGESIVIRYQDEPIAKIAVNGYAYPNIDRELLRETMPYLTWIAPFTYGFTEQGDLVPLNDPALLNYASAYGVSPLLHLSTLTPDGQFSNNLASVILNQPQLAQKLLTQVLETMQRKGYRGLDIDFEFVFPRDRDAYTTFVRRARERLNEAGYEVMVALAPKTSSEQRGLLYEGHDYAGLGAAANAVFLMTYEWGYTYGPPLAVAPLPSVRQVVEYAVNQIPADKIYLGMPNYGYDWTLPFVRGTSRARLIGNQEAVEIARMQNAAISYSETDQAPHFRYYLSGKEHEVWFEDARSVREKLLLIKEYALAGVGYWNLMRPFPQNWQVLDAMFDIEERLLL